MRIVLLLVALAQGAWCGFSVRMPYLSPAGVTYVDGALHSGLHAGSLAYTTATARPLLAAAPVAAPLAYATATARPLVAAAPVAAPVAYSAPVAAPVAYHAPAVAYQPVTKYAAVPTVQHVPGVADVPITRYEAHPAVIQKAVDVAKPAIKTRKYEIRRPAIQKQFYDIEERTIVREAGSALVELEQPLSKTQKGASVISPVAYAVPTVPFVQKYAVPTVPVVQKYAVPSVAAYPAYARYQPFARFGYSPLAVPTHIKLLQGQLSGAQPAPTQPESNQQPQQAPEQTQTPYPFEPAQATPSPSPAPQQPQSDDDDDSVSVENPEFAARSAAPSPVPEQESAAAEVRPSSAPAPETAEEPQARPMPETRAAGIAPISSSLYDLIPQGRSVPSVVPSVRNIGPEISQSNQQRLIQLLTANGGVTEVGLGRSGPAVNPVGEAGQVRARVLSATPAPPAGEPTGERVNTRRVVISRPIETVQEIEVQEPVTKLERIHVNHPTFIKTARQDLVRVPTSVPVVGKALAPVAHGAVPVAHAALPYAHAALPYAHAAAPSYSTYYG